MAAKAYPIQVLIYVTQDQADALKKLTRNVSQWARDHIESDTAKLERKQRREAQNSEVAQ